MTNEPLEGRIVSETPTAHPESLSFAQAVSRRYQESLWGPEPASITVDLENVEQKLEEKRHLAEEQHRDRKRWLLGMQAKRSRGYLIAFIPGMVVQLLIAIFITAVSKDPSTQLGVWFCWLLVALETLWSIKLYRDWQKDVAACEDLA